MLDEDFNIKLKSFTHSVTVPKLEFKARSSSYLPPETYKEKNYSPQYGDLFALGVILFIMVSEHKPFTKAEQKDPVYKFI